MIFKFLYYLSAVIAAAGLFLALSGHAFHHALGGPESHTANIFIGMFIFVAGIGTLLLTSKKV